MLALAEYEAGLCPICGGPVEDCQSPDVDGNNPLATWKWQSQLPVECHKTTALRRGGPMDPSDTRALIGTVRRVPRGTPGGPPRR